MITGTTRAVLIGAGAAIGGLVSLVMWLLPTAGDDLVDRQAYAAGWVHVVGRQGGGPGAASAYLRTDAGMEAACDTYAGGYAQLDGVTDVKAFLAGCHDAITMTHLEPTEAELQAGD